MRTACYVGNREKKSRMRDTQGKKGKDVRTGVLEEQSTSSTTADIIDIHMCSAVHAGLFSRVPVFFLLPIFASCLP